MNLARSSLDLGLPTPCPISHPGCLGPASGQAGEGQACGALGGPGVLAHLLVGPSGRSLEGAGSAAWRALLAAARLSGWGLYLWL